LGFPGKTSFLVTGGAGFIGSNLVEALLDMGFKVRCLDNFSTGLRDNIAPFKERGNFEFFEGDICDFDTCQKVCAGIDYVLHQAALGSVPRSIKFPLMYEENTILLGMSLKHKEFISSPGEKESFNILQN
jgi:UDP-N-acetylglucosamine 4-epimerase